MLIPDVKQSLSTDGYALVPAKDMPIDEEFSSAGAALVAEWDELELDEYLQAGGTFRRRRYARFRFHPATDSLEVKPYVPYFQSKDVNKYGGGIERNIAPLSDSAIKNEFLRYLLRLDFEQFPVADDDTFWDVQCHQFRIIGRPEEVGDPTPEGPHRDEVEYGAIHLMSRTNVVGGVSQVYKESGGPVVTEFSLTEPLDTMFWADQKVLHAVTPVRPDHQDQPAIRDVLILGFQRETAA